MPINTDRLTTLPREILFVLISFLTPHEKYNIRSVCKLFSNKIPPYSEIIYPNFSKLWLKKNDNNYQENKNAHSFNLILKVLQHFEENFGESFKKTDSANYEQYKIHLDVAIQEFTKLIAQHHDQANKHWLMSHVPFFATAKEILIPWQLHNAIFRMKNNLPKRKDKQDVIDAYKKGLDELYEHLIALHADNGSNYLNKKLQTKPFLLH